MSSASFICPERDGTFEDSKQCDKYWECYDGVAEERLCPDGLVFDPFSRKALPCDHYFNVDCGDRLELRKSCQGWVGEGGKGAFTQAKRAGAWQRKLPVSARPKCTACNLDTSPFAEPPKGPNDLCPRLNGFYAHPDPGVCNIFYACVEGVAEEYTCAPGLWFDEYQGVCNWPGETDRQSCTKGNNSWSSSVVRLHTFSSSNPYMCNLLERESLDDGFKCPVVAEVDAFGVSDPHPKYADPADCAKFYICLNGVTPREQGCELGLVFNTVTAQCDAPENVPEW